MISLKSFKIVDAFTSTATYSIKQNNGVTSLEEDFAIIINPRISDRQIEYRMEILSYETDNFKTPEEAMLKLKERLQRLSDGIVIDETKLKLAL